MSRMPAEEPGAVTDRTGALAVAAVALAASVAGSANALVQDDISLLVESSRLHGLTHWREIFTSSYWPPPHAPDLWRPITSFLLALEYGSGGGSPWVFRAVSYLLYALVAVLGYRLAARILPRGGALAAGLVFAAHPVHVEAVALGVGQSELLVALFALAMVIRYLDRRCAGSGDLRAGDWAWLLVLYLAASLSKEHGLVIPGLLIAAEICLVPGARRAGGRPDRGMAGWLDGWNTRLIAGYAMLSAAGIGVLLARRMVLGTLAGSFVAAPLEGAGIGERALLMLQLVPRLIRLLAWPIHLQADYSPAEIVATGFGPLQLFGLLLVMGALGLAWLMRRKMPAVTFGVLWLAIALLPVSNLLVPTGILLAERTMLLPSMGFVLILGGLIGLGWDERLSPALSRGTRRAVLAGSFLVVTSLVARSAVRHRIWRSDSGFRAESARDAPRSWRSQLSYASLLFESGQRDSAIARYRRALEYAPPQERWKVANDLALEWFAAEDPARAVEQLRISLREAPTQQTTRHYLVLGLLMLGSYDEAASQSDSAMARGGSPVVFQELRVLADSARKLRLPPGAIRIRVRAPAA